MVRQIGFNKEFVYGQFNEQMDKTIMEAKGEIEAFCQIIPLHRLLWQNIK